MKINTCVWCMFFLFSLYIFRNDSIVLKENERKGFIDVNAVESCLVKGFSN